MRRVTRPFWVMGLTAAAVCLAAAFLPFAWLPYVAAATLAALVLVLSVPVWRANRAAVLVLVTVLLAVGWFFRCDALKYRPLEEKAESTAVLCASVELSFGEPILTVLHGDLPKGTRLYLRNVPLNVSLDDHELVETEFLLHANGDDTLSRLQAKASGIFLWADPVEEDVLNWQITAGSPTLLEWFGDTRDALTSRVLGLVSGDIGAVITGLCMGADETLSLSAALAFRRCGITHLFAVSGLHLSVLTQVLLQLLKRCRVPRRVRSVATAVAVVLFAMLVGWTPSVIRAGFLCAVVAVGLCLRRQADARNSLGLALLCLLVENPFSVYDAGLLLSFLATFGLVFFSQPLTRLLMRLPLGDIGKRLWRPVASAVAVTLSATVATLPVTVLYFGAVSVVGVLANVLLSLPAMALLIVGWLAILLLLTGVSVLYQPLLFAAGWLSKLLLAATKLLAVPAVSVRSLHVTVALLGGMLLVACGYRLWRHRGLALAACLAAAALVAGSVCFFVQQRDTVRLEPLDTDVGMAILIHESNDTRLVIASEDLSLLYDVQHALNQRNITQVSAVWVLSNTPFAAESTASFLKETVRFQTLQCVQTAELVVGGKRIAFTAGAPKAADAVFTKDSITVYQDGNVYRIEKERNRWPSVWIRDGEWLLKSQ